MMCFFTPKCHLAFFSLHYNINFPMIFHIVYFLRICFMKHILLISKTVILHNECSSLQSLLQHLLV